MEKQSVHRSGVFKQTNKTHKHGRHRSKGSISIATKGKLSAKALSKKKKRELGKQERRNQLIQVRRKKKDNILLKKHSLGGFNNAPFLVGVVPLNKAVDPNTALSILSSCDQESIVTKSSTGANHVSFPRFKQRFTFTVPSTDDILNILDALKVCDTVLFVVSAIFHSENDDADIIDSFGRNVLLTSIAQGLPTTCVAVTDLESVALKQRNQVKQNIQKLINNWLPEEKLLPLDKDTDALNVIRKIGNQKQKRVAYRDVRPHIYAEDANFTPDNEDGNMGSLKITGFLRGSPMSANDLVHIPWMGDFQLSEIDIITDPFVMDKKRKPVELNDGMEVENIQVKVLERADPSKQESLQAENIPDVLDSEQTWPTEEEMKMAEEEQKMKKVKIVPKGWSDYQAAWIPDEDAELASCETESDSNSEEIEAMSEANSDLDEEAEEVQTVAESEIDVADEKYDKEMDLGNEKEDLVKIKEAKTDFDFPDQIDTPQDTPARIRFQKYRGLESFRTSAWDVKENLPYDYGRIFQFKRFKQTAKSVLKNQEEKIVMPGWYITVHIKNVSQFLWNSFQEASTKPLIVFGMLPNEQKMSVLNAVLKRTSVNQMPIKSKETLVFQCGYRRFTVSPIFSQHTNGTKHKYERFFQPASVSVATFYAPIQFPPAPVLCFKEINNESVLVAHGNLLSCNPDRLVIKRVVLSGHPFKIYKRSSIIRFMFFNREDIVYFKSVKLRTRCGKVGHIKEPLGTHGHMKCVFDGQLKSMDTVFLHLYKRIFPKWTYEPCILNCNQMDT